MKREYAELSRQMELDEARQRATMEELRSQLDIYKKHASDYQRKIRKLESSNSDLRKGLDSRHLQILEERRKELLSGDGDRSAVSSASGYLRRHSAASTPAGGDSSPHRSTSRSGSSSRMRRGETRTSGAAAAATGGKGTFSSPSAMAAAEEKREAGPTFDWLQQRIDQLVHLKLNRYYI